MALKLNRETIRRMTPPNDSVNNNTDECQKTVNDCPKPTAADCRQ